MSYIFEDILAEYWWLLTHDQAAALPYPGENHEISQQMRHFILQLIKYVDNICIMAHLE